jgi:hypothetical protein
MFLVVGLSARAALEAFASRCVALLDALSSASASPDASDAILAWS